MTIWRHEHIQESLKRKPTPWAWRFVARCVTFGYERCSIDKQSITSLWLVQALIHGVPSIYGKSWRLSSECTSIQLFPSYLTGMQNQGGCRCCWSGSINSRPYDTSPNTSYIYPTPEGMPEHLSCFPIPHWSHLSLEPCETASEGDGDIPQVTIADAQA